MLKKTFAKTRPWFLLAWVVMVPSCGRQLDQLHLVCIVDLTGSVEQEAQATTFDSLESSFEKLRRGDSITIIPITGDALTEGQARILRFQLSEHREAYDSDLRHLAEEAHSKLQEMQAVATSNPYAKTDILGAIELAAEDVASATGNARKVVVILSDYIPDDGRYNFKRDARLSSDERAKEFAKNLAGAHARTFEGTSIFLGLLRSSDLKSLPPPRRSAIRTFWTEYFHNAGALAVSSAIDGPGHLVQFLKQYDGDRRRVRESFNAQPAAE